MLTRYHQHKEIYMHREVLFHSFEGREMELITLTSYRGITEERENMIEGEGLLPFSSGAEMQSVRPFLF